uniref:Protein kinase domain-containing protein n=1 Tax=Plectus sambesii TaxID=2011161 RepID=A0A914UJK8_9BILA
MNGMYSKYSVDNNGKEEDNTNRNEKLFSDNDESHEGDKLLKEGHDYKAIGENFEIEPDKLVIMKPIGKGYFSDVHMGMLSSPNKDIPVAVKTTQMKTGSINEEESKDILKRQRQALRDELDIFVHLQSSAVGGHENVLKLLGAITTIKTDFSLVTEYCECGSMDSFLQAKWKNGDFVDELIFEANENEKVWKV